MCCFGLTTKTNKSATMFFGIALAIGGVCVVVLGVNLIT